ncbi:MAG: ABC transporter permease [Lachnospiraceae bacterium]|nr:ABC transporter permease [Lachnospiraceae bacterium]
MAKIKELMQNLSRLQIVLSLIVVFSLVLFSGITVWCNNKIRNLEDQQAAVRWDDEGGCAQVSCFFTRGMEVNNFQIMSFEKELESALTEAAVTVENENARLYVDAYSAQGKITVVSSQSTLEAQAIGIGGDFFFFHPLQLVSGGYFSGNDLMKDSVILDEEAAWQLFGSSDIEGMSVTIGGVPHYISGVIKREEGRFAENAGLNNTLIYVSEETLSEYGTSEGISCYEVAAPNPVKGFVYNTAKEKFGLKEDEMLVVENSSRYSLEAMIPVVLDFGLRSMQNSAVHFPYWENIAKGYEDIRAVVLIIQFILLLIPAVIILITLIIKWKNRKYTMKDIWLYLMDKKDRAMEKARAEKNKWEHF